VAEAGAEAAVDVGAGVGVASDAAGDGAGVVPGAGLMTKDGAVGAELVPEVSLVPDDPTMREATDGALVARLTVVRSVSGALVSVDT
jgi:hypothetical protein